MIEEVVGYATLKYFYYLSKKYKNKPFAKQRLRQKNTPNTAKTHLSVFGVVFIYTFSLPKGTFALFPFTQNHIQPLLSEVPAAHLLSSTYPAAQTLGIHHVILLRIFHL